MTSGHLLTACKGKGDNMELTKNQKRLLKLASRRINYVLKNHDLTQCQAAWELWFAYDAVSSAYHQIREEVIAYKFADEAKKGA
jgi:hypothetical protein